MAGRGDPTPEEEMKIEEAGQPWVDLVPTDVLHLVALRLPPLDLSSFQRVCKLWRSLPMESYPLGRSPLFLFREYSPLPCRKDDGDDDNLYFYSPLYNVTFSWAATSEVLDIFKSPIMYSKDGWLVFFRCHEPEHPTIVFVNLFLPSTTTAAIIKWRITKWRMLENCSYSTLVSMSAPPTDPACVLLLVNSSLDHGIEIMAGSEGGTKWKVNFANNIGCSFMCHTSPVFHGGVFYFLMGVGTIGIYDPHRNAWAAKITRDCKHSILAILVESDGELLNVVKDRASAPCKLLANPLVYKLRESRKKRVTWVKVRELGGRAWFLDERQAISSFAEFDGMRDRIFYSKFLDIPLKVDCELHRSAGGDLRLVPGTHVGWGKLARRGAKGKLVGTSLPYSLEGVGKEAEEEPWMHMNGVWVEPN